MRTLAYPPPIPLLYAEFCQEFGKDRIIFAIHYNKSGIDRYPGIQTFRYNNGVCMTSDVIVLFKKSDMVFFLQQICCGKSGDAGPDDAYIFNITTHRLRLQTIPHRNGLKLTHVYT